ncbi:DUF1573 domain-containing protein [Pedobacter nutrimenti]|uniref:Uncharacterized protein DUF1573 n=1 Tax=Pedobacter nutrimenti TaxID=1241337 RepID=A0A318U611_9SPHI|nr:DUF1573 domain-containing protein [Pedobacter nutrimenti]PYF68423.1 uncharacterized protein DUF1573 [Pedobacter nutrimenti]
MKKTTLLCLLAVIHLFANAQIKGPGLKFNQETISYGKISQGVPVEKTFEFINNGKTPLIISDVKPTCGCTAVDFTKVPVKPGKSGFIKVSYNAATTGPFNKTIQVNTNADTPIKILTITGEVLKGK